ncbi:hypothetical protein JCM19274_658 [Algibacter lectus]|uniref:Uncharacterized protein n=1 Tax=Algibacter lectus TaxID=221126 RepID=A0A090WVT4_9FLAO|nr:hypothetical protein JCM19274_658 [Algibacter lectus]
MIHFEPIFENFKILKRLIFDMMQGEFTSKEIKPSCLFCFSLSIIAAFNFCLLKAVF